MRLRVLLLVLSCLLAWGRSGYAQDQSRPFIKISHIGVEDKPLFGAFISTRKSVLDEKLELAPGYRAEPVFLVSRSEFAALLRFARRYVEVSPAVPYSRAPGTFQLAISDGHGFSALVITRKDETLDFVTGLGEVMDGFGAAHRKDTELWDALKALGSRLAY